MGPPEEHRVAALEAYDHVVAPRCIDQALIDEALHSRMQAAALAHEHLLRPRSQRQRFLTNQGIVKNDARLAEHSRCPEGQEIGSAGPCPHEIDGAAHLTNPAATVWFVASSMRIMEP